MFYNDWQLTVSPAEMTQEEIDEAWKEHFAEQQREYTYEDVKNGDLFSKSPEEIAKDEEIKRQFKINIKPLINESKKKNHKNDSTSFGKAKPWLVVTSERNGLDINGYKHSVDVDGLVHINDRHGEGNETIENQIPVTDEDIENIPDVVNSPDYLVYGIKSDRNLDTIGYLRTMSDGITYYVEEIRDSNKQLSAKTMYKIEGWSSEDLVKESLHHTSETNPPAIKLVNTLKRATIIPAFNRSLGQGTIKVKQNTSDDLYSKEEQVYGRYNQSKRLIELFKGSTPETILHELSHNFLLLHFEIADKYGYSEEDKGMFDYLSNIGGHEIKSYADMTNDDKENLTSAYLEYMRTNQAPTLATKSLFEKIKKYVLDVYAG